MRQKCILRIAPSVPVCGYVFIVLGVVVYSVLHDYIAAQIRAGVLKYAVLSSPSAGQWGGFVDSRDPSGPEVLSVFNFYDITNPDEVVAGGKPKVNTIGPLTYKYVNTKHNISWQSDGDIIEYTEYQRFFAA